MRAVLALALVLALACPGCGAVGWAQLAEVARAAVKPTCTGVRLMAATCDLVEPAPATVAP